MLNANNAKRRPNSRIGVHSIDFLGQKFSLTYESMNGKFQTNFGGYLTILLGMSSILVSVVIFSQLFNTNAPVVTTSLEFGSEATKYNLYKEDLIMPLSLALQGRVITTNLSKYVTLRMMVTFFRRNNSTGQLEGGVSNIFNYIPCSEINDGKLSEIAQKVSTGAAGPSVTFCPDLRGQEDQFFVQYDITKFNFTSVKLMVYPCSLPDATQCAPQHEVNQLIFVSTTLEKFFVSSDKKRPMRELNKAYEIRIDASSTKYKVFELKLNRLVDDTSQLSSPKVTKEFTSAQLELSDSSSRNATQVHCSPEILNGPQSYMCAPYMRYSFDATGKTLTMSRSYKGFIIVMGELGGVIKILSAVIFLLYSFYSTGKMKSYFSSTIFNLDQKQLSLLQGVLIRDEELESMGG